MRQERPREGDDGHTGPERGGGHCDRASGNGHAASEILFSLWAGDIYTSSGRFVTSPALTSCQWLPDPR